MRRQLAGSIALAVAFVSGLASAGGAQVPVPPRDTIRPAPRDSARPPADTTAAQPPVPDTAPRPPRRRATAARPLVKPPITPRRALIYSLLLPGLGQSRLDRSATGAFFVAIEAGALAMVGKSVYDLSTAKAFRGDSLVSTTFPVDTAGNPLTPTGAGARVPNNFSGTLVRARRLHLEDWLAVIAFNHLIAGAEAFVSANLWDVPAEVSVRPGTRGTSVAVSLTW